MPSPIECSCPECDKILLIHSRYAGKLVRCNNCKATIRIPEENLPVDSAIEDPPEPIEPVPKKKKKKREVADHRGGTILTMGILSFFCFIIFGPLAWIMGNHDLKEIDEGRMDSRGKGLTRAGQILGLISIILFVLVGLLRLFFGGGLLPQSQTRPESNGTKESLARGERNAKPGQKTGLDNIAPNPIPTPVSQGKLVPVSHKLGFFKTQYDSLYWKSTTLPAPKSGQREFVLQLVHQNFDSAAVIIIEKGNFSSALTLEGYKKNILGDYPKAEFLPISNRFINGCEAFLLSYYPNDPKIDVVFTSLHYFGKNAWVEIRTVAARSVYPNVKSHMEAFIANAKFDDN